MTKVKEISIKGAYKIDFDVKYDSRGSFFEVFRKEWVPGCREMIQGNQSFSLKNVLRGLHFHTKQADYWRVLNGKLFVALYDLRADSPSYKHSFTCYLDSTSGLYIPPMVAHGFMSMEDSTLNYLVDEYYNNSDEFGILWNDPQLRIDWPGYEVLNISDRDRKNPFLKDLGL